MDIGRKALVASMSVLAWGLLWWDDGGLLTGVSHAADRYQEKHGEKPNVCFVHPDDYDGETTRTNGCKIVTHPAVLKNCYWIGVEK